VSISDIALSRQDITKNAGIPGGPISNDKCLYKRRKEREEDLVKTYREMEVMPSNGGVSRSLKRPAEVSNSFQRNADLLVT
jgi:hypothetical protein